MKRKGVVRKGNWQNDPDLPLLLFRSVANANTAFASFLSLSPSLCFFPASDREDWDLGKCVVVTEWRVPPKSWRKDFHRAETRSRTSRNQGTVHARLSTFASISCSGISSQDTA